jgi:2-polyprenyl-6-hydroxyphenyl methylase/3-demethylubiquinone-9 3-methyltransferase
MPHDASGYRYGDANCNHAHAYLLPALERRLALYFAGSAKPRRLFDLGCGNGSVANQLYKCGYQVTGVDPSADGIAMAKAAYPHLKVKLGSAYDDLQSQYGTFPVVYSLEVIEHLYNPRGFAATLYALVESGGLAIVSTPYHGYLKNLAVVAAGKFDQHFDPLWDHGHIKFWSQRKLRILMEEAGFISVELLRVGRIAPFAKSMLACARKR